MKTLTLEIHQDELFLFFELYDKLTELQKKIWRLAVWWTKRFPNAHPNQSTIAGKAGCSREHVNRTLSLFKKWGWLSLIWRGKCRPKTLAIPYSLQMIDVVNREYFKRVEITSKITHSYSSNIKRTSREKPTGPTHMGSKNVKGGIIQIPPDIGKLDISFKNKLKLSLVDESIYYDTYEVCKKMSRNGKKIGNPESYFVGTAIQMAYDRKVWVDWAAYRRSLASAATIHC